MARNKGKKPTPKQKQIVQARLRKKYPQMYESAATAREKKTVSGLSPADRKTLLKMTGLKLKKIYGGKR